jgi:hypothetical protein
LNDAGSKTKSQHGGVWQTVEKQFTVTKKKTEERAHNTLARYNGMSETHAAKRSPAPTRLIFTRFCPRLAVFGFRISNHSCEKK